VTKSENQYIERALVVLADKHSMYLYRTKNRKWWVGNEYEYGRAYYDSSLSLKGGAPSIRGFDTIREAIDQAVAELRNRAGDLSKQRATLQRQEDRIRANIKTALGR
jgi:hypothetical protein